MKIYRRTDRIKLKIDEITVTIAPLSLSQKSEIQNLMKNGINSSDINSMQNGIVLMLKYGLKDIQGLTNSDDTPYKLELENDMVSDECVEDIFNIEFHGKLINVISSLMKGISSKITDANGKEIEGVEFVSTDKGTKADPNS